MDTVEALRKFKQYLLDKLLLVFPKIVPVELIASVVEECYVKILEELIAQHPSKTQVLPQSENHNLQEQK